MIDRFRISSLLSKQLMEHKLALPALLRQAALPATFFQQEKIYATTAEFFSLWRAIGELCPDPGIGLKLGTESRLERYHPAAIAAVCSRSFRDALQRMARYKQLTCPEEIRIQATRDEASVEFFYLEAKEVQPDVLVDLCLSWVLSIGRRGTEGQVSPLRLELTRAARNQELLETHFGCRVRFKADRNALVFRGSDLDRPFVTHNVELLRAIGAQLETDLQERNASANLGEQVKRTLKRSLAGKRPTLQQIARELGMSARTLQRRLGEANVTFQQLVEETRRELAHHYLKQSTVELNETAFLLGYEDANSFFRAFHLWEGTSPGEWRTRRGATGVAALGI
jgi:AraC-like DNA-binding protein